jgi:predicted branched-subunit amino acid permease
VADDLIDAAAGAARRENRAAFWDGVRQISPALVVNSTWGLVTGVAMVKSGMSTLMALIITVFVFSGTMQLTVLPLLAAGVPLWLVAGAGSVVNVRFVIFNAGLYPFFRDRPWLERAALGFFNSDMAFAIFMARYSDAPMPATAAQRWFFIGMLVPCWITWELFSVIGVYLSAFVPTAWSLEFAATLALMAITVPMASSRPMLATMVTAGVTAWVGQALPLRLGLAAAVVLGIVAGMMAERHLPRRA